MTTKKLKYMRITEPRAGSAIWEATDSGDNYICKDASVGFTFLIGMNVADAKVALRDKKAKWNFSNVPVVV